MQTRRNFLTKAGAALGMSIVGASGVMGAIGRQDVKTGPSAVEDVIAGYGPFVRKELFDGPVLIESMELLERDGNWFVRVRSTEGAEGIAVSHSTRISISHPVFNQIVASFFIGKDARDLDTLLDRLYMKGANYKMQGQLLWVSVASAEFAILDLLGKVAKVSAADLLGGLLRKDIPLYVANNHRWLGPEASLVKIVDSVDSINARAVKFKLGGRMKSVNQVAGRTEKLIPMVADALGDRCVLYADANSSYVSTQKAIEIGYALQDNGFSFYEEPCPFDYLEETKTVADALEIPIAWGEQESSLWRFKWMIDRGGVQIPQPDLFYFGGIIRSLRVAKMAAEYGLECTPHISGVGLGFLYMGIYASCCPNPGAFQEYKGIKHDFPWESTGDPIEIKDGSMKAPTGPGIGVEIDESYLRGATRISS